MSGNYNDETNFSNKLSLPNRQIASLCKEFANNSTTRSVLAAANINLSRT